MYTTTFNTNTSAYGIDAVVEAFHSHLGTFSWHTGHLTDGNQSISNLGHLSLKQTLQELRTGTAQHDTGVVVLVLHFLHHGTDGLTLAIAVRRNLVTLHQM